MKSRTSVLEETGRIWLRNALSSQELALFDDLCDLKGSPGERVAPSSRLAVTLDAAGSVARRAQELMPGAFPVRTVVFNKTTEMNWSVPWHQDRVIAVQERFDVDGYKAWSRKAGQWHVEPPLALLESMLFARVHLDDTGPSNGCLELALGSHRLGRVSAGGADTVAGTCATELCRAKRGDVLFVKALTLHRSGSSQEGVNRRTLRIDFAADALPDPLKWDI